MSHFDPSKLQTKFISPASALKPILGRKYTLTHSDESGELYLSIGTQYDNNSINLKKRDEVIAEWTLVEGRITLIGTVYVTGGEFDEEIANRRFVIFQKELPLALKAIFFGDRLLFSYYPYLLHAPIYIQFQSVLPRYHQMINYGTPTQYLNIRY
ncbi:staygreen family protein [Bacillus sp. S/N-304-OC-R1]|uniref:staygreen family protein n=1 Tax=Bacillus sp. S/N-304-OC-R1 TaxID=2758034 RepID=UPI001C8E9E20|nr:staygreen family protein [Bacillus sp. S/N-304-OC-R1]MBY0120477.1 staygreen family protein [Bacillus sp. S/N-304-OC-R1]